MTHEDRKRIAYHEAGHAIVGLNSPQHDPIHKVTIIPRGQALGLVVSLPERDQLTMTAVQFRSKIAMAMGGRVAEELVFGSDNVTSGAASDIQQVTKIARAMVTKYGMSERLGTIDYSTEQDTFLGAMNKETQASPETRMLIDEEVRRIVDEGHQQARKILVERREELERLAQGLLEYETLSGEDLLKVIAAEKPTSPDRTESKVVKHPRTAKARSIMPKVRRQRS